MARIGRLMERTALLVIGAGPYGLATAAEARRRGIATLVVGEPMHFWRRNMPAGMLLRSGREWHLDAAGVHTFDAFVDEPVDPIPVETDRKSTRLNSSHTVISYAVFCLKKKN